MDCIKCDDGAGIDRVIVDILTDAEVGCLCESCLDSVFNPVFKDDIWHEDSGCAVCSDDPQYYLPPLDLVITYDGEKDDEIEYGITESTVRLCMPHLKELLDSSTVEPTLAAEAISQ